MSQWGARGFADRGWGWRRILTHYYPGTALSRVGRVKVRVLAEGRDAVAFSSRGPFRIVDARGRSRVQRRRIVFRTHRWHGLQPPLRIVPRREPLTLGAHGYRGSFVIRRGISVVNVLPLERYLRGVVPWECRPTGTVKRLAQAVASRTYALANVDSSSWYDLYPDTRDQMYGGIRAERDASTTRSPRRRTRSSHGNVARRRRSTSPPRAVAPVVARRVRPACDSIPARGRRSVRRRTQARLDIASARRRSHAACTCRRRGLSRST